MIMKLLMKRSKSPYVLCSSVTKRPEYFTILVLLWVCMRLNLLIFFPIFSWIGKKTLLQVKKINRGFKCHKCKIYHRRTAVFCQQNTKTWPQNNSFQRRIRCTSGISFNQARAYENLIIRESHSRYVKAEVLLGPWVNCLHIILLCKVPKPLKTP